MAEVGDVLNLSKCEQQAMGQFLKSLKSAVAAVKEFNSDFMEFLNQQKKLSKDLSDWVTRYNILNA